MEYEDEGHFSLDVLVVDGQRGRREEQDRAERAEEARRKIDEARVAMAALAMPAVTVLACRLYGMEADPLGRAITDEREKAALTVLDRVGMGRLRLSSLRSSLSFETETPTALFGAYGKIDEGATGADDGRDELDPATVDGQIAAFLEGARVARDLRGGE